MVLVLSSCTRKFEDLNKDPKNPLAVPSNTLISNAMKNMGDQVASTNVNTNNFRLWSQYWTETTYTDESNYDIKTRGVPDNAFTTWYRDVISDLEESIRVSGNESILAGTEGKVANQNAIADLLIVYSYQRLVDMFGNVPYSQAMDIDNNLQPVYDDAWTIYQDLVSRIDADLAVLDASEPGPDGDLIYGGDVSKWIAFAQGMKLKMGITIADFNASKSVEWVNAAAANVMQSADQNAQLAYLGATPNTNPLFVDLVLSGRKDFVAASTIIDTMKHYNDMRIAEYYTENCLPDVNGNDSCFYSGGGVGESNNWGDHSKPGSKLVDPTLPVVLMSYEEMLFYLAEAADRGGYSVGGSAQGYYEGAINASFAYWGAADAATYLATPGVAWGTGGYTAMEQIARESWLAFYNRGFVAWTQIRRLDFQLPLAAAPQDGNYPIRYTYPINEQTLNGTNYTSASNAIGGDHSDTPIFWDVN
jgi:hypothetical protein